MTLTLHWWIFIPLSFLAGSIPFGYLIGRAKSIDIRTVGSGNIGATNLGRALGKRFFYACFFLDMTKGMMPTLIAGHYMHTLGTMRVGTSDAYWWLAVMIAAVLGHMFTPWLGFKGGKGVATGLGAMVGVLPAMAMPATRSSMDCMKSVQTTAFRPPKIVYAPEMPASRMTNRA